MNQINRWSQAVVRSSLLWGMLASLGFFSLLDGGAIARLPHGADWHAFLKRYTAGHPIEYVETGMFFVGLAALVLKWLDVAGQQKLRGSSLLGPVPAGGAAVADVGSLLGRLDALGEAVQESYLMRRLRGALEHVRRSESADDLEDHLKYLADVDAGRAHGGYAFIRILIWAIPIMGFLGTVVGITMAIANLSPQALEQSLPEVTHGLGVAFDTTALALVLSTVLMFVQYLVDKEEGRLLDEVECLTAGELAGRFVRYGTGGDPQVAAVRRMADSVISATEQVVRRQAELWQGTLDAADKRWSESATAAQSQLTAALRSALSESLDSHARQVAAAGAQTAEQGRQLWSQIEESLERTAAVAGDQRAELARQGDLLLKLLQTSGQVIQLEETLNRNLAALAGSQNFEETVESLAAVIHLLNARLSHLPGAVPAAGRPETRLAGQAA